MVESSFIKIKSSIEVHLPSFAHHEYTFWQYCFDFCVKFNGNQSKEQHLQIDD